MSRYIKYIKNGGKTMYFMIKDDSVLAKYNEIWNKTEKTLNAKLHTVLFYDKKYIKAKVRQHKAVIKTNFSGDEIPKEDVHHACITCVSIDSVMRMEKKKELSTSLFRRMQV